MSRVKRFNLISVAIIIFYSPLLLAHETGYFKDEKNFIDLKTKAKIIDVSNFWGVTLPNGKMEWKVRYVRIELPIKAVNLEKIAVIGENGVIIPHNSPSIQNAIIEPSKTEGVLLKLFIEHPEGFKFKLRMD